MDYEKLPNLDHTAYEHSQDFQEKLEKNRINYPSVSFEKDDGEVPEIIVKADDSFRKSTYIDVYRLEAVTKEEFEEIMFDTWKAAMKDLEF